MADCSVINPSELLIVGTHDDRVETDQCDLILANNTWVGSFENCGGLTSGHPPYLNLSIYQADQELLCHILKKKKSTFSRGKK